MTHRTPATLVMLLTVLYAIDSLHIAGTFSNKDFFTFLAKFGFQKADTKNLTNTKGYIYGTIHPRNFNMSDVEHDMYLVVVDSQYFTKYYAMRDKDGHDRCTAMFSKIDSIAWDQYCLLNGKEDFLRRIPCEPGQLCVEEQSNPAAVQMGQQFTFHIVDPFQPRFWYISLVSCSRGRPKKQKQCSWSHNTSLNLEMDYDIWFVNGDPNTKHMNPFEHQFSYELHDVLEIYLTFLVLNGFLLTIQVWVFRQQRHVLIYMLTAILTMEVTGIFFNLVHITIFAFDGEGVPILSTIGNFIDICAQCVMMLQLLYIAKGWTITTKELSRKPILYSIWVLYTIVYIILFVFTLLAIDPIRDLDEWQTTPGYCILGFRIVLMIYFLYELQDTFTKEDSEKKRHFYTRFGAGVLVWFIYLPIVALVSPKIATLWRFKTLLSIQSGADFAFLAILLHLFWPGGDTHYFDIPKRLRNVNNNALTMRTALLSGGEESSEDELYERQANIRLKTMHRYDHHRHVLPESNGHINNNGRSRAIESPVLSAAESPF